MNQLGGVGIDAWHSYDRVIDVEYGKKGRRLGPFADSYLQFWFLTHYLTFGAPELAPQLEKCLLYADGGMPPLKAFKLAFGMTPQELWFSKLKHYTTQFSGRRYKLTRTLVAEPFSVGQISASVAEEKLELVRLQRQKKADPK